MNNKLITKCLAIVSLLFIVSCGNEAAEQEDTQAPKQEQAEVAENVHDAITTAANVANTVSQYATINFGVKSSPNAMDCRPGVGICEIPNSGEGTTFITIAEESGLLTFLIDSNSIKEQDPELLHVLEEHSTGGIIQFESNYTFPSDVSEGLGASYPITIGTGYPISVLRTYSGQYQLAVIGALPGHAAEFNFSRSTEAMHANMDISAVSASSLNPGLSFISPTSDNSVSLYVFMNTWGLDRLGGDIRNIFPQDSTGNLSDPGSFNMTNDFYFTDPEVARSLSITEGWFIPSGSYICEAANNGWFYIQFTVLGPPPAEEGKSE